MTREKRQKLSARNSGTSGERASEQMHGTAWVVQLSSRLRLHGRDHPHWIASPKVPCNVHRGYVPPASKRIEMKIVTNNLTVALGVNHIPNPHLNRLRVETSIAERHDGDSSRLEHTVHFL